MTSTGEDDEWPAWSPDGSKIVFTRSNPSFFGAAALYIVSAEGSGLTKLTRVGRLSVPAWSPDGKTIAFTAHPELGSSQIRVVSIGARRPARGRLLLPKYKFPAWSPDGSKLALVGDDDLLGRVRSRPAPPARDRSPASRLSRASVIVQGRDR